MIKNKKAQFLWIGLIGAIVLGIAVYYIEVSATKATPYMGHLGEHSYGMLKAMYKAETMLFYADQAAMLESHGIIINQALQGGILGNCGTYGGYTRWTSKEKECYPSMNDVKKSFFDIFRKEFFSVLSNYPDAKIPLDDYEVQIVGNKLIGISAMPAVFPIEVTLAATHRAGEYYAKPSFEIGFEHDFRDYEYLKKNAEELIEKCKQADNALACMNGESGKLNSAEFTWRLDCDKKITQEDYQKHRTFGLCVSRNDLEFIDYKYDRAFSSNVVYKFSIYVPEEKQQEA